MNIFIDESGSFVNAAKRDSWNTIAAYMSPEYEQKKIRNFVRVLKRSVSADFKSEIKLRDIKEEVFFEFLRGLNSLDGVLFAVATDAGINQPTNIIEHQQEQAKNIVKHKEKMIHHTAREGLQDLSAKVASLSPQLYVQLQCQVDLISKIISRGILYFVQRAPMHLGCFKWKIDQKNSNKTEYEKAFATVSPAFLQSISLSDPIIKLIGADYSAFKRFEYTQESRPKYLRQTYGLDVDEDQPATNVGLIMREDIAFVDSKHNLGVQVSDLLACGIRRCLRQGFENNKLAARLIGLLMVQGDRGQPPIQLRRFSKSEESVSKELGRLLEIIGQHCRSMLVR